MNIENNHNRLSKINNDRVIQNLIAQASARYILLNTEENRNEFPKYTIQDENLNILAMHYIDIGCFFAENNDFETAKEPLEKGASILEHVHFPSSNKGSFHKYYSLISALSYYVSFQYSKAFLLIEELQSDTIIAELVALFLKRNFEIMTSKIESMVIDDAYKDSYLSKTNDGQDYSDKIYEIIIAKSLYELVQYLRSGDTLFLSLAKEKLNLLKEISELRREPSIWWVIRLLLLISESFNEASLWSALNQHFDIESPIVRNYIKSLVYNQPRGIYELFITQRKSLSKVLNDKNNGCVVTIPTSSGKTRIAEIAILDCIIKYPNCKIFYIAPFRSLAFEVESSLEKIFRNINISVSQLYGGTQFTKLDELIINESQVIIATPEKTKAILRIDRSLAEEIKLIIIDEGHLLGAEDRLVSNEIFYEELRFSMESNDGKFLILSAVLPNAEDLALWLTKSTEYVYKDNWRASGERLGFLEWRQGYVNLDWFNRSDLENSFNKNFIISHPQPLKPNQRVVRYFPQNKNEAIAATAYKLSTLGTVLIFVGIKRSVFVMAKAYLDCLGSAPPNFIWANQSAWLAFEMACLEIYGENNEWLLYAKKGILCHHGTLHTDVRIPLERLMRGQDKPLVIIATSSLGQGVNIGVSTVIFATLRQGKHDISCRDFWNIAGRAGRSFIDLEAKVLVALDYTADEINKTNMTKRIATSYFKDKKINNAISGILQVVIRIKNEFDKINIPFDVLIELIATNDFERIKNYTHNKAGYSNYLNGHLDLIDDALLSLQNLHNGNENNINLGWIDHFFRASLGYIQVKYTTKITQDQYISFIKARIYGIVKFFPRNKWELMIQSGIPISSNIFIEDKLSEIVSILDSHQGQEISIDNKIIITLSLIKTLSEIPVFSNVSSLIIDRQFNDIVSQWLKASSIASYDSTKIENTISKVFSFTLPWVLNGVSKHLKNLEMDGYAEIIEELSILIELGLPTLRAVKIYQAGIRSRIYANELSLVPNLSTYPTNKSIRQFKDKIYRNSEHYKHQVSKSCGKWIDQLVAGHYSRDIREIAAIENFTFDDVHERTNTLVAKNINGINYLLSPDFSCIEELQDSDIDFSSVNNVAGVYFKYQPIKQVWKMIVENPYLKFN